MGPTTFISAGTRKLRHREFKTLIMAIQLEICKMCIVKWSV